MGAQQQKMNIMRLLFPTLYLVLSLMVFPAMAQQSQSVEVDKENVSTLISTLENEEQRQEFLDQLKTLVEVDAEINEEPTIAPVTEALGIEAGFRNIITQYEQFLEKYNLQGSTVGKASVTVVVVLVLLVILYLIRKAGVALRERVLDASRRLGLTHNRFRIYSRVVRYVAYAIALSLFAYTISVLWNFSNFSFLKAEILGDALGILFVVIIGISIWEAINTYLENLIHTADREERNRLRTLLPIIRNVVFMAFSILFVLVILSELGIDILPLLAGAGILGIAIGFGAQTVVKDFLTGFTIILEDLIQVGDVASLGGKIGLIEKITIRKVQLRDLAGIVYTVPFSDVGIIENWTKDFSFYPMDIGVAYREDTDEVVKLLREVDEDLRSDENFKDLILEPLEVLGVDAFADSAVIIKARIKTKPVQQWNVGREFNRRMKYKFDEHGVEIPFPHQTIYFGEDKEGKAPAAAVRLMNQQAKKSK